MNVSIQQDVATSIATSTAAIVQGLYPAWITLIGVCVAFFVLRKVIQLFPKK